MCGAAIEYLSIFVEKYLYKEFYKIESKIKGTPDMLNILTEDSVPVSFDIINMFSSIDNVFGLETVSEILENRETDFPPAECIFEALELCLKCNNVVFDEKFYLQEDGTAMEPHMSCCYSDIAIYRFNLKALSYTPKVFLQEIQKFFEFINSIATSSGNNVYIIMSIANNNSVLEFLDLSLHINEHKKICVDVYAKSTNNFTNLFTINLLSQKEH